MLVYYHLGIIYIVLSIMSISYDNIALIKVIAETGNKATLWQQSQTIKKPFQSDN